MSDLAFYLSRRDELLKQAAETKLGKVRERCERAAAAFGLLAHRAELGERTREKERIRRAESGLSAL